MKKICRCLIRCADNRIYDLALGICKCHVTVFSETCLNQSCSKAETLLRRTDTFDPACFLYASPSRISETVKMTLLQTDNFFQSSDKEVTCLTRTRIKVLGIYEKKRIDFDIFVNFLKKERFFYTLKQQFFWFHFAVFEGKRYFWVWHRILNIVSNNLCRYSFGWSAPGESKANNWKKIVEWQTWFLKRWEFSYAVHLWCD